MSVFPFIIDSKPGFLRETHLSLLQLPCGEDTLLSYFGKRLAKVAQRPPVIIRDFDADPSYDETLLASAIVKEPSVGAAQFGARLGAGYEPSDWLLIVDPRSFALDDLDPMVLLGCMNQTPRMVSHFITLATSTDGTSERVELDWNRRVRRIQRYYDSVTWTVAQGVACSVVPVASLTMFGALAFGSLIALRQALAAQGVPSRDLPIPGLIADLRRERGFLLLNERLVTGRKRADFGVRAGSPGHRVHPTARIVGPVVLHSASDIERDVTIVGPAVIGAGACIQKGAVVAQCVVAPGVRVSAGAAVRHRLILDSRVPLSPEADLDGAVAEHPPITEEGAHRDAYPLVKRWLEAAVALAALIVLAPLMALVAALVKLESRGPILFGDRREAKDGRVFDCYKFRTMRQGAEAVQRELMAANEMDGPQFKIKRDPRVTRLGRWLRLTSLDELPQLFNVVYGEMSIVGPRPSPFRENQTCVPWREARLSVRPGITGLWQVCRHDRHHGDFHQWIHYDIEYVRNMSLLVDLKIIMATLITLGGKGHVPLSWIISSAKEHA